MNDSDRFEVRKKYKTMMDDITVDDGVVGDHNTEEEKLKHALDMVTIYWFY